jgi:hypothetical protein
MKEKGVMIQCVQSARLLSLTLTPESSENIGERAGWLVRGGAGQRKAPSKKARGCQETRKVLQGISDVAEHGVSQQGIWAL